MHDFISLLKWFEFSNTIAGIVCTATALQCYLTEEWCMSPCTVGSLSSMSWDCSDGNYSYHNLWLVLPTRWGIWVRREQMSFLSKKTWMSKCLIGQPKGKWSVYMSHDSLCAVSLVIHLQFGHTLLDDGTLMRGEVRSLEGFFFFQLKEILALSGFSHSLALNCSLPFRLHLPLPYAQRQQGQSLSTRTSEPVSQNSLSI